jgi:hypothetical protein
MRAKPVLLALLVVCVLFAAALGLGAALDVFPFFASDAVGTAVTLAIYAAVALGGIRALERRTQPRLTRLMLGVATLAAASIIALIWLDDSIRRTTSWEVVDRLAGVVWSLTVLTLYLIGLTVVLASAGATLLGRILRTIGVAFGSAGTLGMLLLIAEDSYLTNLGLTGSDLLGRATAVGLVIGIASAALLPLLSRFGAIVEETEHESTIAPRTPVSLTCPRCATEQTLRAGAARCDSCGLRITIEFEEPRCRCGYLLYGLDAEACPECGRPITQDDLWRARPPQTRSHGPDSTGPVTPEQPPKPPPAPSDA